MRPRISITGYVCQSIHWSISLSVFWSIGLLIRRSVSPSVRRSVGPSVGPQLVKTTEIKWFTPKWFNIMYHKSTITLLECLEYILTFLNASSHLYKRLCPSVRRVTMAKKNFAENFEWLFTTVNIVRFWLNFNWN